MTTTDEEVEEVNDEPIAEPSMEEVNDVDDDDEQPDQSNEDEVSTYHHITQRTSQLTKRVQDRLNNHQRGPNLQEKPVKKDSTLDILTVMLDRVSVKFKVGVDKCEVDKGRWCNICK